MISTGLAVDVVDAPKLNGAAAAVVVVGAPNANGDVVAVVVAAVDAPNVNG